MNFGWTEEQRASVGQEHEISDNGGSEFPDGCVSGSSAVLREDDATVEPGGFHGRLTEK